MPNLYILHITLYDVFFFGMICIGMNFAALLWFGKNINRSANRFLAMALVTMILWMIRILFIDIRLQTYLPTWDRLATGFLLALGPLIYFYVLKITRPEYKFGWKDLLHFTPLLLEQGALILEIRESIRTGSATYATSAFQLLNPVLQLLIFISIITYLHKSHKLIQRFYSRLQPMLMDRPLLEFRWLRRLLAATALLWLLWLAYAAFDYFGYRGQLGIHVYYPFYIFFVVIIIWTAAAAFLRPQAGLIVQPAVVSKSSPPVELRGKSAWLKKAVEANRYYQDPELSLSSLAEKLDLTTHELSRIINTALKKSFNDFINEYRVRDVISKMQDPIYGRITLLGIAYDAGFYSKATFIRAFKQSTGKNPAEYKREIGKEVSNYRLQPRPETGQIILVPEVPIWSHGQLNYNYMFRNYFKIAWRNMLRNKFYAIINVTGLTVGLTACLLVATVVLDDLSYDRQWKNADHIYRIVSIDKNSKNAIERSSYSFSGLGPNFKKLFPEVKEYCRMHAGKTRFKMGADKDGVVLTTISAEPSVWKVLNFDVVAGNPAYYQKGYSNLVITQKIKDEYFPDTNPIGKVITNIPEFGKPSNYMITGIIKDIPANTTLRAEVLEIGTPNPDFDVLEKGAYGSFAEQYLLLQPGASISAFEAKANKWLDSYFTNKEYKYSFTLQNIKNVYLRSTDLSNSGPVSGDIRTVYIFSGVAVLLLLIACINFVNLTTARALKRIKEAGIRKVLGAEKRELIAQFLFESLLFFLISFIAGMFLYTILLKPVETYLGHTLTLTLQNSVLLLSITTLVVLLVSLLTGIYPAMLISAQNPVATLKGKISSGIGSNVLRKGLVVAQFTISVAVLIVTIVVQTQLRYMNNKNLGFNKNNLLDIKQMSWDGKGNVFKRQVTGLAGVENATMSTWSPGSGSGGFMSMEVDNPQDKKDKLKVWYINADFDFVKTLGFKLQKGRLFDPKRSTDAINTDSLMAKSMGALDSAQRFQPMLITSLAARTFGIKEFDKLAMGLQGVPVGVINDFNNESLKSDMKPAFIRAMRDVAYGDMLIRVRPGSEKSVLAGLHRIWQKTFPDKIFQYDWTDEVLKDQYKAEHKLQQLFTLFSFLILSLAALGLFGLTMFIAELRVKEIGIRKVLGASASVISITISKDFVKLVFIAVIIASPVAWYFGDKWLQNYSYRISIHWWVFVLSGLMAVMIAILTISYQTIKAALANPVKSLRSE